jgi:hypothetical protein
LIDMANRGLEAHSAAAVRHDIEQTLRKRITPGHSVQRRAEDAIKSAATALWHVARHHPYLGTIVLGAAAISAASAVGATELALGFVVAYEAFMIFKGEEAPQQAAQEMAKDLEHGV